MTCLHACVLCKCFHCSSCDVNITSCVCVYESGKLFWCEHGGWRRTVWNRSDSTSDGVWLNKETLLNTECEQSNTISSDWNADYSCQGSTYGIYEQYHFRNQEIMRSWTTVVIYNQFILTALSEFSLKICMMDVLAEI